MAHPAAALLADAGVWLLAQAAPLPDTVVTKLVPVEPGPLVRVQQALSVLATLAVFALTAAAVPAVWGLRHSYQKVSALLDRVYADVAPLAAHAARIAANVDQVSVAVRENAERATALLSHTDRRLHAALERAEARARDLEALLDVAQAEAEHSLVSAASTVAGVREGVASLRDDLVAAVRGDAARDALGDDAEDADDAFDEREATLAERPRVRERRHG